MALRRNPLKSGHHSLQVIVEWKQGEGRIKSLNPLKVGSSLFTKGKEEKNGRKYLLVSIPSKSGHHSLLGNKFFSWTIFLLPSSQSPQSRVITLYGEKMKKFFW